MKTIGLIGGMSWESTTCYYQIINQTTKAKLGGLHSAKIVLYSVDFHEIEQLQQQGNWQQAGHILAKAAQSVEAGGADFVLICTNTMHKVAEQVTNAISIPLLHIADATGAKIVDDNITKVGLLGTNFTMEQDFYKQKLIDNFGLEVLIPNAEQRQQIHHIIYQELCLGQVLQSSKATYLNIIDSLVAQGAQAIILGCTEIGLLINENDTQIPLFDTTKIHAQAAVEIAIKEEK